MCTHFVCQRIDWQWKGWEQQCWKGDSIRRREMAFVFVFLSVRLLKSYSLATSITVYIGKVFIDSRRLLSSYLLVILVGGPYDWSGLTQPTHQSRQVVVFDRTNSGLLDCDYIQTWKRPWLFKHENNTRVLSLVFLIIITLFYFSMINVSTLSSTHTLLYSVSDQSLYLYGLDGL